MKNKHIYNPYQSAGIGVKKLFILPVLIVLITACSDFVAIELPKQQLATDAVFNNPTTAEAALKTIYGKMRYLGLLSDGTNGLNMLMGLYSDELDAYADGLLEYQNHTVLPTSASVKSLWGNAYNQIYAANAVKEGVEQSVSLTVEDSNQFIGEALFARAYLHLYLVALFGDIPYITTTDYIENTTVSRMPADQVYAHIITDLTQSAELLSVTDISGERIRPYAAVAEAALARAYLYTEDWAMAETMADKVIAQFGALEPDLNKVFLKGSTETIWQFIPSADGRNADGGAFIFTEQQGPQIAALTDDLYFAFESGTIFNPGDKRQQRWVKTVSNGTDTWRHAYKYKERTITSSSVEYSIQLRLAEQYLIRAEARTQSGDISGARADINVIRNRAGLSNTTATTLTDLLDAILQERRVELFTEKGHRWFDLKRMGKAAEVLAPIKPNWKATNVLLPIPESEILLNPNLLPQNEGY